MTAFPSPPPITESIPQNFPLDVLPLPEDALFASSFQEGYVQRTQFISGMTIAEAQAFFESSLSRADDFSSRRMAYDVALSGTLEPWTFTVQISKSDAGGSLINIVAERAPTNTFRSGDTATEIPMDELLAAEDSTDAPPNTSAAATGTPSTDAPATGSASQPPGNTPR